MGGVTLLLAVVAVEAADYPCLIEPYQIVNVTTAVEGILVTVDVEKGDIVQRGEVVAVLESAVEKAAMDQAQARVNAMSAIKVRKVRLERARKKHQRVVKLSSQKFVSPEEVDELKSAVELAELELQAEHENKLLAELELQRVTALYQQRFIKSPITGAVVERYLGAGEFAQAQPIIRLAQLNPLNVEVVLSAEMYDKVLEQMKAEVMLKASTERVFQATVTIVERVIDGASGTFGVRLELPNPDYKVTAGLECRVLFLE